MRHPFRLLAAVALLACSAFASADQVVPLDVGGKQVKVSVPNGYIRTSVTVRPLYDITAAALPVIWVAFGGRKDITAALIGTLIVIAMYQSLTIYGSQYAIVVMGVLLVLTVLFAPEGIILTLARWISRLITKTPGK